MNLNQLVLAIGGTVIGGLVLWILLFPVRRYFANRPEKNIEQTKKLRIHFEDINRGVINYISEMARSLAIRHERLVTTRAPISESYDFEGQELYKCFELHFPEEAREWRELNKQAVEFNEKLPDFFRFHRGDNAQIVANEGIIDLQQKFHNFAQRLANKVESIDKYEMGKTFKKHKDCPICKKF